MMPLFRLLCLAAALLALVAADAPGGFRVTINQRAIDYVTDIAMGEMRKQLSTLVIPDMSQDIHSPIGKIRFDVTSIRVSNINIPNAHIQFGAPNTVTATISGLSAHCSLHWHYKEHSIPHVSDSGSGSVDISSTSVNLVIGLGVDANGRTTAAVQSASLSIGGFGIKLHGGQSWLYNLFVSNFKGKIKSSIEKSFRDNITHTLNTMLAQNLAKVEMVYALDKTASVDFSLVAAPTVTSQLLDTNHKGMVFLNDQPALVPPGKPPVLPSNDGNGMAQIFFSDYTVNTAAWAYFKAGTLWMELTSLPAWSPIQLKTNDWFLIVPAMVQKFPDLPMRLDMTATESPSLTFTEGNGTVMFEMDTSFKVIEKSGNITEAFGIHASLLCSAHAELETMENGIPHLIGSVSRLHLNLKVVRSIIGDISAQLFDDLAEVLVDKGLIPIANAYLKKGFPLPGSDGITFQNPKLAFKRTYLEISTDFTIDPSILKTN